MIYDFIRTISKVISEEVAGLKKVALWRGQYQATREGHVVDAPVVYIELVNVQWQDAHQGAQQGIADINIHFVGGYIMEGENVHEDTFESSQWEDSVMIYLDRIQLALQQFVPHVDVNGEQVKIADELKRTSVRPASAPDELQIWIASYRCKIYDTLHWRYRGLSDHQIDNLLVAYKDKVSEGQTGVPHIDSDGETVYLPAGEPMQCTPLNFEAALSAADLSVQENEDSLLLNDGIEAFVDKHKTCPPDTPQINTANTLKTGQTVSYATNDDADNLVNRLTDFTTLDFNNPFGNTNRFTDEFGTQVYANDIVIDWGQFDASANTVIGFHRLTERQDSWALALSYCAGLSVATYEDWFLPNINILQALHDRSDSQAIGYAPFGLSAGSASGALWSSTTIAQGGGSDVWILSADPDAQKRGKTQSNRQVLPARVFTLNELGL